MSERDQQRVKNAIDALRRKPENKQCADCKSLSVPYINLTYGTFVCARCAGIHREFDHRVKSVSNSVFKLDEIQALGGNDLDRRTYLPYWNEQIFKMPEPGSEDNSRVREFIRLKYVDRRFCQEQAQPEVPAVPAFTSAPGVHQQIPPEMVQQMTQQIPQQVNAFAAPQGMPQQMGMGLKPMGMPAFTKTSQPTLTPAAPFGGMNVPATAPQMQQSQQQFPGAIPQGMPQVPAQPPMQMQQPAQPMFVPQAPAVPQVAPSMPFQAATMPVGGAPQMPGMPGSVPGMSAASALAPGFAPQAPAPGTAPFMPGFPQQEATPAAPLVIANNMSMTPTIPSGAASVPVHTAPLDLFVNATPVQPPQTMPVQPVVQHAPQQQPMMPAVASAIPSVPSVNIPVSASVPVTHTTNFNSLLDF